MKFASVIIERQTKAPSVNIFSSTSKRKKNMKPFHVIAKGICRLVPFNRFVFAIIYDDESIIIYTSIQMDFIDSIHKVNAMLLYVVTLISRCLSCSSFVLCDVQMILSSFQLLCFIYDLECVVKINKNPIAKPRKTSIDFELSHCRSHSIVRRLAIV